MTCSFSHCLFNPLHQHKDARNLLPCLFAAITYKVVIKTGKQLGGSTTTAQVWMTLAGNITDTGVMNIPKNENEFRFQVTLPKNFPACSAVRVQSGHVIFSRRNFPFRGQNAEIRTITEPLLQAKKFIKASNRSNVAVAISSRFESVFLFFLFRTQHTNLGVLTTLRIGHDNSG